MSSARALRSAFLSLSLCVLAITSCRTASEIAPGKTPASDTVVSTTPPFQTREPQRYSATRTITVFTKTGDTVVTKTLIARDGSLRREEQDDASMRVVYLESPEGRFILLPGEKLYAAANDDERGIVGSGVQENSPDRLLHTEPISTTYQALGTESVAGRSAAKYRIIVNDSVPENVTQTETLMWIDNNLNMPIKSETTSPDGTRVLMELSGVTLEPDKQLFQIPANYEKIAITALQKQLNARRLNP